MRGSRAKMARVAGGLCPDCGRLHLPRLAFDPLLLLPGPTSVSPGLWM